MIMQLCGLLNFTSKCHAGLEHRSWSTGRHTQGALVLMWADKPFLIKMELEYVPIWSWKANWQHPYSHVALLKDELRLICINLFFSPILRMLPQNLRAKQVGNLIWFCGTNGNSLKSLPSSESFVHVKHVSERSRGSCSRIDTVDLRVPLTRFYCSATFVVWHSNTPISPSIK